MALSHATFRPTSRGISSFDIIRLSFVLLMVFSLVLSADMAGFTAPQPVATPNDPARFTPGTFAPGEVLVKFKEPAGGTRANNMGIDPNHLLQDSINKSYGLAGYQELEGMPGVYKFTAAPDSNLEKLVAAIALDPQVEYAEPNYLIHAKSAPPDDTLYTQTYTDTSGYQQSRQWYLSKIGITELWNIVTGTNTLVAVLDTGVNPLHQDLCLNAQNSYVYITYTIASSSNPFNTYCSKYSWPLGYNFTGTSPTPGALDDNGHGTAVAGIIAGTTNNTTGIAGINWNARILPVKVLDKTGVGTVSSVSQGLIFAANANARIINVSWSQESTAASATLQSSVVYAQNKGALVIAAVGDVSRANNPFPPASINQTSFPGAFPGVIGVGATDEQDNVLTRGYNDFVSVVAPGKDIFTTYCDFVTPQGKPDLLVTVGPIANGPSFPGTLITTTILPQKVINTTTKYAYQACVNPDPQRYPVTEQSSAILDPCTLGDILSCDMREDFIALPPDPTTTADSSPIEVPGGTLITRTTTINNKQASVKSYYAFVDGSSYSAAIVSGLASLIVAANPSLTNAQIKSLIEASTDQLLPNQVINGDQGYGRVNAARIANAIVLGGGVIPQPPAASGVRGVVTNYGSLALTDIDLNLDPIDRTVAPNPDGGFLFDNLAAGTYYLRLRVRSSGRTMGPVKIMLTGRSGEEFHITFDVNNNQLFCDSNSVCPGNAPGSGSGITAFTPASPIPGALYFNETGHNISNGFRDYWVANGGLAIFGYPLSEEFTEVSATDGRTYTVQYFQRNRFEYHPENQPPYKVLLGLLGSEDTRVRGFVPVDPIKPTPTTIYFKETGHSLKNQFLTYWQTHGGLAIFGYPISEAFQDGQYYVQYFQRNRFELHPENFGTPYEVLLGLLGTDLARARGYLP